VSSSRCCASEVDFGGDGEELRLEGSSTECALVQLAIDAGLDVRALRASHQLRSVQVRTDEHHYVAALHAAQGGGDLVTVKGAPNEVLALCSHVRENGEARPLTDEDRARIERENERMAAQPLRVLGCAQLDRAAELDRLPQELVWLGLVGMEDPPRKGVGDVLASFRKAGVRTIMITGDQGSTAEGVARQVGLGDGERIEVVDATELAGAEPEQIRKLVDRADVFSRVSPADKLGLVRALQAAGFVTAMTGDGVNDSPALKAADIGVAMGASGSNAAREVADLVIEDDELSRMVTAMREGRAIYGDIRKAVRFILATNSSEILLTFACVATGMVNPLSAMQLLWINIITDIFPELALAVQPPEDDVLSRPPRDPERPMFNARDLAGTGLDGAVIAACALAAHLSGGARAAGSSVAFTTLVFAQLLHAYSARSEDRGLFDRRPIPANPWLTATIGGSAALQLAMSLLPPLRSLLGVTPLGAAEWSRVALGSVAPLLINEARKLGRG
jgi:P-type Ca2+ transporter type 2C